LTHSITRRTENIFVNQTPYESAAEFVAMQFEMNYAAASGGELTLKKSERCGYFIRYED
jgi:hypothetical protein